VYNGGFVTGGSRCTSEPLLTMDEQVRTAGDIAKAVNVPVVADGGAGFGEPLHTMRTVKEFINAGISGIHIEDQLFPKRAHYHKYVAHVIPRQDFVDKIKFACRQRDETEKDFVIIARSDSCRFEGLEEAVTRVNMAAESPLTSEFEILWAISSGVVCIRDPATGASPQLIRLAHGSGLHFNNGYPIRSPTDFPSW
jgi:Phosphoenolpyruvate phosphomutase